MNEQKVICGNNIDILKSYPDNYFDAIVTDPPYGLGNEPNAEKMLQAWLTSGYLEVNGGGFMGKEWDAFVPQPIFWKEVFRVLKFGGYVLAFYGTRTYDWGVMAMRLAGFEVRDSIQWVYGSGFPKSHNISKAINKIDGVEFDSKPAEGVGFMNENGDGGYNITKNHLIQKGESSKRAKEWEGWGSALKPAVEPIVVCRKPLEKGLSIAENVLKWGVGGINIDGCRVGEEVAKEYTSQDTQGRFPANIILECICDELIKGEKGEPFNYKGKEYNNKDTSMFNGDKPEAPSNYNDKGDTHTNPDCPCYIMDRQSGISKSSDSQRNRKTIGSFGMPNDNTTEYSDKGGASRFFYQAKASKSERNRGLEGFEEKVIEGRDAGQDERNVAYKARTSPRANTHPTIKPVKLMQYLVRLVTPPNGLVLDPFCGSGTTGIACKLEGFNFVGMEREEEYAKIAQARIENFVEEEEIKTEAKKEGNDTQNPKQLTFDL